MGWSVVSAATVATLMAVIQWVATAAATPAGQVSIDFRKKIIQTDWHYGQK